MTKQTQKAKRNWVEIGERYSKILLLIFAVILIILGIIGILIAGFTFALSTVYSVYITHFILLVRSISSSALFIGLDGIVIAALFLTSRKWIKAKDKNGWLFAAVLSLISIFLLALLIRNASYVIQLVILSIIVLFALQFSFSILALISKELSWKKPIPQAIIPLIIGFALLFLIFELTTLNTRNIAVDALTQAFYSAFSQNLTYSNSNISYTYPSSWQNIPMAINLNGYSAKTFSLPMLSPNVAGNATFEVLIPTSNVWNAIMSLGNLNINSFTSARSYSPIITSNASLLAQLKSLPIKFSMIVVGYIPVNQSGISEYNELLQNLTNTLGINLNQPLPINFSSQLSDYILSHKDELKDISYSAITAYVENISGSKGILVNVYNFGEYLPNINYTLSFSRISIAFTLKDQEFCGVLGVAYDDASVAQMSSAFNAIVSTLNCK
jgi:hypothetical protein